MDPGRGAAEGRGEEMFTHPELRRWLPSERLVAGNDSGGFVFDQRVVTKALRDIGPLEFLANGEPFAGCLFHEMVIADGRKMSKHLGNVVDPDALVGRYGADTVRLAVLYAAGPAKTLNWTDGALRFASRFLNNAWQYTHERIAMAAAAPRDAEAAADTAFIRERLGKWCENGVERITADLEELQMHKAVRNVTRLFERIRTTRSGSQAPRRPQSRRRRGAAGGARAARAGAGALRSAHRRGAARGARREWRGGDRGVAAGLRAGGHVGGGRLGLSGTRGDCGARNSAAGRGGGAAR